MSRLHAALLVLTLASTPAAAYVLRTDSTGEVVRWSGRVELVIDQHLAAQLGDVHAPQAIAAAVATVGAASPEVTLSVKVGATQGLGYRSGSSANQNDIVVLTDWPYDERALAATIVTVNTRTHQIVDADIAFNGANHTFRVVDLLTAAQKQSQAVDDIQNTITHELGHAVGLMHNLVDPEVVMYPSAAPLEISKRVLAGDDRAGLAALYGLAPDAGVAEPSAPEAITGGCTAAGGGTAPPVLLALFALLALRRRRSGLVLALAPAVAMAAAPADLERLTPDLGAASRVAVAAVTSTRTVRVPSAPGLLFTEVALAPSGCLKGACPASLTVLVPGGREGDLEQIVAHQPVPRAGEAVLLADGPAQAPKLLRLADPEQRERALTALARVGLSLAGSAVPQVLASPPPGGAQAPATTR